MQAKGLGSVRQEDRHQHDERRAEERSQDRAEPADDHHEQDEEGQRDVEGGRLGAAEVEEDELRGGDPAVERADDEGEEVRSVRPYTDVLGSGVTLATRYPRICHM